MTIERRLTAIEKRLVPRRLPRELKVHFVFADEFTPKDALRFDYGGIHEDDTLIVEVVKTEDGPDADGVTAAIAPPDNGKGEQTAELEREILLLEKRKARLQAKAKA